MKRNLFYTIVCGIFIILMLIGFFLPIVTFKDSNYTVSYSITGIQSATIPLLLLFFGGISLSFFVFQKTEDDEQNPNWPLAGFAGLMGLIALIFLIRGLIEAGEYELYTYTLSFSPFYMIFIALIFGAFYRKLMDKYTKNTQ